MKKYPVIIDTDPGIDDAYALMLAKASESLDIKAITVSAGNVGLKHTTRNSLGLCELLNINAPVYKGAEEPIIVEFKDASEVHGGNGLGGYEFNNIERKAETEYAWDAIYRMAKELNGELSLITLGPLTNIAIALLKYPKLPEYIKKIVVMGGAWGYGNTAPYSEFNFWFDPHAAEIVLKSGMEIYMVGLNVTKMGVLSNAEIDTIRSSNQDLEQFITHIKEFYLKNYEINGEKDVFHLPDAIAVTAFTNPEIFEFRKLYVTCVTEKGVTQGWSIVDDRNKLCKEPNVHVATKLDKEKYFRLLQQINNLEVRS